MSLFVEWSYLVRVKFTLYTTVGSHQSSLIRIERSKKKPLKVYQSYPGLHTTLKTHVLVHLLFICVFEYLSILIPIDTHLKVQIHWVLSSNCIWLCVIYEFKMLLAEPQFQGSFNVIEKYSRLRKFNAKCLNSV